jgi:formate hydrogenlyase transcriptional activator
MADVLRLMESAAPTPITVLIQGESGTGKELVARGIHKASERADGPFIAVNCAALAENLLESELFGHRRGSFTGATHDRVGLFEAAKGGTIFLDEVGELPGDVQVKLLRVLQEREFEPVGSSTTRRVDVRVIAATNRDLSKAIDAGRFRADLYYRLNVVPIEVPPLRERVADVPELTAFFVARYAKRFGKAVTGVSEAAMRSLTGYAWPGNVRELQNVIERAVVLAQGPVLEIDPTPRASASPAAPPADAAPAEGLAEILERVERTHLRAALERTRGVVEGPRGAAILLKMHPNTLRSRLEKLGIKRHEGS